MPKEKQGKLLCVDNLRHAEYYQMQDTLMIYTPEVKQGRNSPT